MKKIIFLMFLCFARNTIGGSLTEFLGIGSCKQAQKSVREGIGVFDDDPKRGEKLIAKALDACPNEPVSAYNLGVAQFKNDSPDKAIKNLKKSLELKNNYYPAQVALAWLFISKEINIDEGIRLAKELQQAEDYFILNYIIRSGYKKNGNQKEESLWLKKLKDAGEKEYKSVIEEYKKMIEDARTDANLSDRFKSLNLELGRLFLSFGDEENARSYFLSANHPPEEGPLYLPFIYPDEFVLIPPGNFRMGKNDSLPDEGPEHQVSLDTYMIGKYEITSAEYKEFVRATNHIPPYNCCKTKYDFWQSGQFPKKIARQPVINVSWEDTQAFIRWKSRQTGVKYQLPTEAQWEKAARGPEGRLYPWGNKEPTKNEAVFGRGWYDQDSLAEVDTYSEGESFYGINHMGGNVWEWCSDWYSKDYYRRSPRNNPSGPKTGEFKILRGASWMNLENELRTTLRNKNWPDKRYNGTGFRLVVNEVPEPAK